MVKKIKIALIDGPLSGGFLLVSEVTNKRVKIETGKGIFEYESSNLINDRGELEFKFLEMEE